VGGRGAYERCLHGDVDEVRPRPSTPHRGLPRDFRWKTHRLSVTLSVGTPLCPYAIAYCRVVCLIAQGLFEIPSKSAERLHPGPCILNPRPCTLHPAPYTLNPAPCTLHPAPQTLHPRPCTLHPAPCTLRPAPCTLNLVWNIFNFNTPLRAILRVEFLG
jgi:hypothetical protein